MSAGYRRAADAGILGFGMDADRGAAQRVQFDGFEFDPASGELRRLDNGTVQRLPPQPARLMQLLADRRGTIVTREEIRAELWPGTHVEFDASLHFCVRQLRAALGDSASDPRYIQNVPRRGYRLIPDVRTAIPGGRQAHIVATPVKRGSVPAALAAILVSALVGLYYYSAPPRSPRVRIAIMPFQPPLAESVLAGLSQLAGSAAGIIGPTTTSAYVASDDDFQRLTADYRPDYIVNGRPLDTDGTRLLVEVIRVSDGVHVWVRPYDDPADSARIGREISEQIARILNLP
jgi:DNA-binding winged helix-turn-helix (wHTH) protein/TolB-like protein